MILVGALVAGNARHKAMGEVMAQAGLLIWIGLILCYFVQGIIVREVGGVPLEMSRYGGWKIRQGRRLSRW